MGETGRSAASYQDKEDRALEVSLQMLVAVEEGGAIGVYPLHKEGTACVVSTPLDV